MQLIGCFRLWVADADHPEKQIAYSNRLKTSDVAKPRETTENVIPCRDELGAPRTQVTLLLNLVQSQRETYEASAEKSGASS